ncbi:MAG: anti-sigma factor family protein, partial [Brevinematales bacterium]
MFCQEYDPLTWLAYLEKKLKPDHIQAMEKHLENCPLCLAELLEINRSHARMTSLELQPIPHSEPTDHFTLVFHQTREAIETLLGRLSPISLPATRTNASSLWQYTSQTLGINLTIHHEKDSFSLTIEGD